MNSAPLVRRRTTPLDPVIAPDRLTWLRPAARSVRAGYRRGTGRLRRLPDFLVIGAQKSGTTTLFDHLATHPDVRPSATKEVHYFDREHARGEGWYRGHFALRWGDRAALTGEATPAYLLFPPAAARAAAVVPGARLIAVLRDPVDRAYSHYQHEVAKGHESLGFEAALDREQERLEAAGDPWQLGELHPALERHSYVTRGQYHEQLERWLRCFPREQLLVLSAEELYRRPADALDAVVAHLGLAPAPTRPGVARNTRAYRGMRPATRRRLRRHFAPHNERLFALLGTSFDWS